MKIVFINNGSYANHGCEAIIKGTINLFNDISQDIEYINIAHFSSGNEVIEHNRIDRDLKIKHLAANGLNESTFYKAIGRIIKRFSSNLYYKAAFSHLDSRFKEADIIISVGGDNYSMDYGFPVPMMKVDEIAFKSGTPTIVWGASIGPFDKNSIEELTIKQHLKKFTAIFVREDESLQYLSSLGFSNRIFSSSDPAFRLPKSHCDIKVPKSAVGLNVSPLYSKFLSESGISDSLSVYVGLVEKIVERFKCNVVLIPHVNKSGNNDFRLLTEVYNNVTCKEAVILVENHYNASQLKNIISQCDILVAARTHATIAAFSTCVPVVTLSYSIKSLGLNFRLLGDLKYVIRCADFNVSLVIDKIHDAILNKSEIQRKLDDSVASEQRLLTVTAKKLFEFVKV